MIFEQRHIAIEGAIGVGKTSLARLLGEKMNAELVLDNSAKNPFLKEFYEDPSRFAFQTQVFFLLSRYRQQQETIRQDILKTCIISDYLFIRDKVFAQLNLSEEEMQLYDEIYSLMDSKLKRPDLVVYLQASIKTLKKRMRLRNRSEEKRVSEEYIEKLCATFDHFFFDYTDGPILVVNTDEIDFVKNEKDLEQLVEKIEHHRAGREHYAPIS